MEAANLTVSINGDASGLNAAIASAQTSLGKLGNKAEAALKGIKDTDIKVSVRDDTAKGIAAVKSALDSLTDKVVTVKLNYTQTGASYASGTRNAAPGLAMVNDQKGVGDPRELIYHDGHYMMYEGRNVVVPLDKGDRVYTAEETRAIMRGVGIPHYAYGTKNTMFEMESGNFRSRTKSSHVSLDEQIAWWKETLERYAYDYEVVKECSEEIFTLTRKLADSVNDVSGIYIDERTYFNDWEKYGDSALECFERIKENNRAFWDDGILTYSEYAENIKSAGNKIYEGRISQSEKWLKQQSKYNDMSVSEYIEGLKRMAAYTEEYFNSGIINYREYTRGLESINNSIYDAQARLEAEKEKENAADYAHWKKDASNWKKMRDTYGDWNDVGDSPTDFYSRCIERVKEFYDAGKIGWQEFMDDTFNYQLDLYNAQMKQLDEMIAAQKAYISQVKSRLKSKEEALKSSWEEEDRRADMADISRQLQIYSYAVTQKGKNYYDELRVKKKQLERQEELSELQKKNNEIIEALERELSAAEADKKGILNSINAYGINTNDLVGSIVKETSSMQSFLSGMFTQLIGAVKNSAVTNSYTDNSSKTYNIASGSSKVITSLAAAMGTSFLYRF